MTVPAPLGEARPLDLEPIKDRRTALVSSPPIRWGRHDAVTLIEGDIPALIAEVERLRSLHGASRERAYNERMLNGETANAEVEALMTDTHRLCARCGHPDNWHRHDDETCLSKHPQPCSLEGTWDAQRGAPLAPFRCIGTRCNCPDFMIPQVAHD